MQTSMVKTNALIHIYIFYSFDPETHFSITYSNTK